MSPTVAHVVFEDPLRQGQGLDARTLPPEVVSEAARDLLGALAATREALSDD